MPRTVARSCTAWCAPRPVRWRTRQLELLAAEDGSLATVVCILEFANGERIQFRASADSARQALDVVEVRVLRQLYAGAAQDPPAGPVARAS